MFFSSERNLESVLEELLKKFVPEDVRLFMFFCLCLCLCFTSGIIYLFCWVLIDVSEDISCLHAEPRLHCFVYIYDLNLLYQCLN